MAIQPDTNLYLLKCPLELSNKHQLTFSNKNQQFEYFSNLENLEINRISYQRKDSVIRYPAHIDSLLEYNYCMYQNNNYSNKWFYAFIVNMEYVNDSMTNIYIKTDVFQTWQFDLIYKQSFIEREMINVSEDVPGANLIPENLESGENIIQSIFSSYDFEPAYIIAYSGDKIGNTAITQDGATYNGIFSSIKFILCNAGGFKDLMGTLQNNQQADYIVTCFTVPILAVKSLFVPDLPQKLIMDTNNTENPIEYNVATRPSSLNGYTPKNKKLLQFPFCYLGFNKSNGNNKVYKFEDFTNGVAKFQGLCEVNPNPQAVLIPENYKGQIQNLEEIAVVGGYPTVSYKTDTFNSWLAQNANIIDIQYERTKYNYNMGLASNAVGVATDTLSGVLSALNPLELSGVGSSIASMSNRMLEVESSSKNYEYDIANMNAQVQAKELLPDNVSLSSSNASLIGYQKQSQQIFSIYTIKRQFAERIDKYFDMFGYKTNTVKIPNINNRPNWNYVKTIGANIEGFIPQGDLSEIISLFDNGITLWHNSTNFLDYSVNNR